MTRDIGDLLQSIGIRRLSSTPTGFKGCCKVNPNHHDNSPSMHIHVEKGLVKCFSCGAFKPLFSFLIDEGIEFSEAIEYLFLSNDYERRDEDDGLKEWTLGRKVPKSMLDRGFHMVTMKRFEVGYDEFEKRITIPLRFNNILYGVQYRAYPKKFWATSGFNKDHFIYNFEPTEERTYVEGFTDCWKAWQNGTKDVSAILTAYPSDGQLDIMSKHEVINLALDNDKAGYKGMMRIHKEIGRDVELNVIPMPVKDAGDCSLEIWQNSFKNKTSFLEFELMLMRNKPRLYDTIQEELRRGEK
tara:strand:+ start:54438 stop:55334 length:897 start_codon:yes stop_codon:yes gene_type:complete